MLYSFTHVAAFGVKGLTDNISRNVRPSHCLVTGVAGAIMLTTVWWAAEVDM